MEKISPALAQRMKLGNVIDRLLALQTRRRALESEAEDLKQMEREISNVLRDRLLSSGVTKATGAVANFSFTVSPVPVPEDWDATYKYIKANDAFDLLERRIHRGAWKERVEDGLTVPGITSADVIKFHVTKKGA